MVGWGCLHLGRVSELQVLEVEESTQRAHTDNDEEDECPHDATSCQSHEVEEEEAGERSACEVDAMG